MKNITNQEHILYIQRHLIWYINPSFLIINKCHTYHSSRLTLALMENKSNLVALSKANGSIYNNKEQKTI